MEQPIENRRRQVKKFQNFLHYVKEIMMKASSAGFSAHPMDQSTLENLVKKFESELQESEALQKEWEEKQRELDILAKKSTLLLDKAKTLKIESNDDYMEAQKQLKDIHNHRNLIVAKLAPITTAYNEHYKYLIEFKKLLEEPLIGLEETLISWMAKQKGGKNKNEQS